MLLSPILVLVFLGNIASVRVESEEFWREAGVVYAEIVKVDTESRQHTVTFRPIASLCGAIDPAVYAEITAVTWIGPTVSVMTKNPREGTKAIVLITYVDKEWWIPNGYVPFIPNGKAICEVKEFDDPDVRKTIDNLRELRTKLRKEAEQKAAAEKKTSK